jgi:hypothetical protein
MSRLSLPAHPLLVKYRGNIAQNCVRAARFELIEFVIHCLATVTPLATKLPQCRLRRANTLGPP